MSLEVTIRVRTANGSSIYLSDTDKADVNREFNIDLNGEDEDLSRDNLRDLRKAIDTLLELD